MEKVERQQTMDALATSVAAGEPEKALEAAARLTQAGGAQAVTEAIAVLNLPVETEKETDVPQLLQRSALRAASGDLVEAIKDAAAAVTLAPASATANALLAIHMRTANRLNEAILFAYEALKAAPDDPARFVALAALMTETGAHDSAQELLGAAAVLAPEDVEIVLSRMDGLMRLNRGVEAVQLGDAARQRFGDDPRLLRNLGNALRQTGQTDRARTAFNEILHLNPQNGYARHMLAVINGTVPDMADPDYVRAVFDSASEDFEHAMMEQLRCRIPGLIGKAVGTHAPGGGLEILDLGCGTGLCGVVLREQAAYLKGVDISPGMIEVARRKGIYDALETAEITATLATEPRSYDVASAGDVMIYFGRLDPLLTAVRERLKPNGLCVFTVEISPDDQPVALNGNGRFMHSPSEIRRLATACGFRLLALEHQHLRMQNGQPVGGLLTVMRRA